MLSNKQSKNSNRYSKIETIDLDEDSPQITTPNKNHIKKNNVLKRTKAESRNPSKVSTFQGYTIEKITMRAEKVWTTCQKVNVADIPHLIIKVNADILKVIRKVEQIGRAHV